MKVALNLTITLIALLVCCWILPMLIRFFMPFVLGWIIACIAGPLVRFLESKIRIKRKAGGVVVMVSVIALVVLGCYAILSFLATQITGLVTELPQFWDNILTSAEQNSHLSGILERFFPQNVAASLSGIGKELGVYIGEIIAGFGTQDSSALEAVGNVARQVPAVIIGIFMCFLSAYFFVSDKNHVVQELRERIPETILTKVDRFVGTLKKVIGGYLVAQVKIEVWVYILIVIGLFILKVPYGILIALAIACIDILPVFGSGFILWPWAIVAAFGQNYRLAIGLVILWGLGQLVRQMIQPKIVGDSVGLDPLPTLVLLYIGYKFGGFAGMILAVPIGIIFISLYEDGIFDTAKTSVMILIDGVNRFRKYTPEEYPESTKEKRDNE